MMSHEGEGRLTAYVDGELSAAEAEAVERHLSACVACRGDADALRSGRQRVRAALSDHELDRATVEAARRVRARLAARPHGAGPRSTGSAGRSAALPLVWASRSPLLKAALFVLFIAGGAAALVPGSPLRSWIEGGGSEPAEAPPAIVPQMEEARPEAAQAVLSARPANGSLRVSLDLPDGTDLRVTFVDGDRAMLFAQPETRFTSGEGILEATVTGGSVHVQLPRGVPEVSLLVGGEVYLTMQSGRFDLTVPAVDSSDAELSFRIR